MIVAFIAPFAMIFFDFLKKRAKSGNIIFQNSCYIRKSYYWLPRINGPIFRGEEISIPETRPIQKSYTCVKKETLKSNLPISWVLVLNQSPNNTIL